MTSCLNRTASALWALTWLTLTGFSGCRGPAGDSRATGDGGEPEAAQTSRIVLVTHGQSADPFWSVVVAGASEAADELGVRVEYQAPGAFNMVEMSQIIDAAVASDPDGLAISIPDGNALGGAIRAAVESGIPVLSINSGDGVFRSLGLGTHIGQPELDAGRAAGRRLGAEGAGRVLCVNHEVGNLALDARCEGLSEGLAEAGGTVRVLSVDLGDPADAQQRIVGALGRDPAIDGILALGPAGAVPALAAIEASRRGGEIALATFDLSTPVLDAIAEGRLSFAVDQQPYLQGFLAVVLLVKAVEIGVAPDGVIRTGPAFVAAENVAEVRRLVERGVR